MKIRGTHILLVYPPIVLAFVYGAWFAAWFSLGHRPLPGLDDPKGIHGYWMWTYDVAMFLVLTAPLCFVAAIVSSASTCVASVLRQSAERGLLFAQFIIGMLLLAVTYGILKYDPHGIMYWMMD